MTMYRMIGAFFAVAVLAAAAAVTAATVLSPSTGPRKASACMAPPSVMADLIRPI